MSWGMTAYLIALLVIVGIVVRDAWHDRTPRASQVWWAYRWSAEERQAQRMRVRSKKAA